MQATAGFPRPKVCVCEACDLLMCLNLLCYTTPKFPWKFYKDNSNIKKNLYYLSFSSLCLFCLFLYVCNCFCLSFLGLVFKIIVSLVQWCVHTHVYHTLTLFVVVFFFFCFFLFCSLLVLSHLLNGGLQHCRCCQDVHLCVTCSTLLEQPSVWMSQQTWWVIHREFCAELCALPLMVTSSQAFSLAAMWYSVDWWNAWCLELESSAHCSWFLSSVNVGHYLIWRFCLKSFCFEHNGHVLLCTNLWDKYAGHW